jgi:hypothetical protein
MDTIPDEFISRGSSNVPYIVKDPNAVLDYSIDWSQWLADAGADAINTSNWTVPAGITKDSQTNTSTQSKVWLSGGSAGQTYRVVNRITTTGGRTADRSFDVVVQEQ